jgi:hypothetical protein
VASRHYFSWRRKKSCNELALMYISAAVVSFERMAHLAFKIVQQSKLNKRYKNMLRRITCILLLLSTCAAGAFAQKTPSSASPASEAPGQADSKSADLMDREPPAELSKEKIPSGAKVYIAPLNGYESFLTAAIIRKGTPIIVVNNPDLADYKITGVTESHQASWARMLLTALEQSSEQVSVVMTNLKTGLVVWGCNVNKAGSLKGKQSAAEALAKHLKVRIEGRE